MQNPFQENISKKEPSVKYHPIGSGPNEWKYLWCAPIIHSRYIWHGRVRVTGPEVNSCYAMDQLLYPTKLIWCIYLYTLFSD